MSKKKIRKPKDQRSDVKNPNNIDFEFDKKNRKSQEKDITN